VKLAWRLLVCLALSTGTVEAHVKWFVKTNSADAPRPIGDVIAEPAFVRLLLISLFAMYVFFLVDRLALRKGVMAVQDARLRKLDRSSIWILRTAGAVLFLALAGWHLAKGTSFSALESDSLKRTGRWRRQATSAFGNGERPLWVATCRLRARVRSAVPVVAA
jgi:hypothetical protein